MALNHGKVGQYHQGLPMASFTMLAQKIESGDSRCGVVSLIGKAAVLKTASNGEIRVRVQVSATSPHSGSRPDDLAATQ